LRFVVHLLSRRLSHTVRISADLIQKILKHAFLNMASGSSSSAALPLRQRPRRHILWPLKSTQVVPLAHEYHHDRRAACALAWP
jgi:hypothetical protein